MKGRYAVLLNSDTILKPGALDEMFRFMEEHPAVGMCGPQLLNADGTKQNSVGNFGTLFSEFMSRRLFRLLFPARYRNTFKFWNREYAAPTAVDYIVGACMFVRKKAMDAAGLLDEDFFFLWEEVELCHRMTRSGWPVYHLPNLEIYHISGQSIKEMNLKVRVEFWTSRYFYFKKSLALSRVGWYALLLLGFLQNVYHFLVYSVLNIFTLFVFKRMRKRWLMFSYLLVWHARGRPVSMGIPR